ncbi:hypothetical protein DF018_01245 [Burkholderia cenocepacia]|uniref:hypothetical protein n=1 Tax=Burkholderia sp. BCC0398 TaxID=2676297 RepID=UPI000F5B7522|nr:hypothetical protein [Burkholderia sp. BCC0398]RQV76456.1 hypothetical protein DF018_01245 [Burkholderia cenocepacia]
MFDLDAFNGELGFIEAAASHALFVDRVGDWFTCHSSHPGLFAYEVAERFGKAMGNAMLGNPEGECRPREILREVLMKVSYAESEVDQAIASVPSAE